MRFFIITIFFLVLASCKVKNSSIIYYIYKSVTITRVNQDANTKFYYGSFTKEQVDSINSFINIEYKGINNGMDTWIIFKDNGDVEIIDYGLGWITEVGMKKNNFYHSHYSNENIDSTLDRYKALKYGMIRISDAIDIEKRNNPQTKVKAFYNE
jgi:hypothetical protein